jgi:hypothetical protein
MTGGPEGEEYLKTPIADYSDSVFGNGVQVGAYARYSLAMYYQQNQRSAEASSLFEEIRKNYPDAVMPDGSPLLPLIPTTK